MISMFGVENSKDKLSLLQQDFNRLLKNPLEFSLAEKVCSDAWHLNDWVYEEEKEFNQTLTKEVFNVSYLAVYLEGAEKIDIDDLVRKALNYWEARLSQNKNSN